MWLVVLGYALKMFDGGIKERAATLLEVLIAGALFLALAVLVTGFLFKVTRITGESFEKSGLQSEAVIILRNLDNDLSRTTSSKIVTAQPNGTDFALSLQQIDNVDRNGFVSWDTAAVLYCWDFQDKELLRKTWPPDTASLGLDFLPFQPPTIDPTQVESMATTLNGSERRLSGRVSGFSFSTTTDGVWDLELKMSNPDIQNSTQIFKRKIRLDG